MTAKDPPPPSNPESPAASLAGLMRSRGLISEQDLNRCRRLATAENARLDDVLVREDHLGPGERTGLYSELTGLPVLRGRDLEIDGGIIDRVPPRAVVHYRVMPVAETPEGLLLATARPRDPEESSELNVLLARPIQWILCTPHELRELIHHFYGVGIASFLKGISPEPGGTAAPPGKEPSGIQDFIDELIREAVRSQATDIHVEPLENGLSVRYRIDGVLHDTPLPAGIEPFRKSIISSLKVMADLDIAERRLPQDGRIGKRLGGREIDLRVSVLPSRHGESVALRILSRGDTFLTLEELGLQPRQRRKLDRLIRLPHGMILFAGPTGSGKTTSQYAMLDEINDRTRKIVTLEDPVEYQIEGITQLQIQNAIGFDFATGLRSVLRHDPDVILVGEIRDVETANISISAALTGHLVLSTLHTNDSAGAAPRLIDMGIEPYLVAAGLQGVVSQRLVRRVCPHCRHPVPIDPSFFPEIENGLEDPGPSREGVRGRGCPACRFTGYLGRRALFELLEITDPVRSLIAKPSPSLVLYQKAMEQGMIPLRAAGWQWVLKGDTSVEELLRVTGEVAAHRSNAT